MLNKLLIICLTSFSFALSAQEKNNDAELISITIENYFDGYIERDISKLNKAFDTKNGAMKVLSKNEDGTESIENYFFKSLIPKWAAREKMSSSDLENCALKILNMDIVDGKIGTAKISMKVGDKTYIDILSLQKMNNNWKITNKIFVVLANENK